MIERRRFMHLAGAAAVATAVGLPTMVDTATAATRATTTLIVGSRRYRSNGSSRIEVSVDGGKTWKLHTDLGSPYAVQTLSVDRLKRVNAQVGYAGRRFNLRLAPDLKKWLTVA